jgi:hypothetical protein
MKQIVFILIYLCSLNALSIETRGILDLLEGQTINVGEAYRFRLTLVPFESRLLNKTDLQWKSFLDLFYITNVQSIEVSENNYDATIVTLDMVLVKKANLNSVYIWQLGDRNIPLEVSNIVVNDVQLNTKNFLIFETPNVSFSNNNYFYYGGGAILLALFLIILLKIKKKKVKLPNGFIYKNFIKEMSGHDELESLYRDRKQLLEKIEDIGLRNDFKAFFNQYSEIQYSPYWRDEDVLPILKRAKDLARELDNGI